MGILGSTPQVPFGKMDMAGSLLRLRRRMEMAREAGMYEKQRALALDLASGWAGREAIVSLGIYDDMFHFRKVMQDMNTERIKATDKDIQDQINWILATMFSGHKPAEFNKITTMKELEALLHPNPDLPVAQVVE